MIFALTNAISDLAGKFGDWRRQQQAYAELSALDDRTLADIGLNRGDLPTIALEKKIAAKTVAQDVASSGNYRHAA